MTLSARTGARPAVAASSPTALIREVFVGSHSKVWQELSGLPESAKCCWHAIGHEDVGKFEFAARDRVWVLSYSRTPGENRAMLERLVQVGAREIVYVSSASTIVSNVTACYEYPRVKQIAEVDALALPATKVLTIGTMYRNEASLPAGANAATSFAELAAFVAAPEWPDEGGRRKRLFRIVRRPFKSALDRWAFRAYGWLQARTGSHPCLLRPLDLVLRTCGVRWYGYVYLSNRLWNSTIS